MAPKRQLLKRFACPGPPRGRQSGRALLVDHPRRFPFAAEIDDCDRAAMVHETPFEGHRGVATALIVQPLGRSVERGPENQFLRLIEAPFPRPDLELARAPRAAAVKTGRSAAQATAKAGAKRSWRR